VSSNYSAERYNEKHQEEMENMKEEIKAVLEKNKDLLTGKTFAHFATLMKKGAPQVSPVWIDYDGEFILVNTAHGRQKSRNVERDARVALSIQDPQNPYRKIIIRGKVVEITRKGAEEHINALSLRYHGVTPYQKRRPDEIREIIKIMPEHVSL
jgi:PPOX class probable F420-dependent enzyme